MLAATGADGQERVRAVVATAAGVSAGAVRDWCLARLSRHKVPRSIVLVPALRYTARGKLDSAWLAGLSDGDPT